MTTLDVYADKSGKYRWRVIARNGKIVSCSGENFSSEKACRLAFTRAVVSMANAKKK